MAPTPSTAQSVDTACVSSPAVARHSQQGRRRGRKRASIHADPVDLRPDGSNSVLARLAALKRLATPQLKDHWRALFDSEPPTVNRPYLESRLAYRIQELAYGGLKPETVRRLEKMGEQLDGGKKSVRQLRADDRPVAGTKLIREWKGVDYLVTVLPQGFEWDGRPYKSLSAIARAITGTRWNGPAFFGLKGRGGA